MKIAIIDYGAGNVQSLKFALLRLGYAPELTADPDKIRKADKVIFPGVGEAASAMQKLKRTGLDRLIPELKQPVLGICLGMQLLCESSEEGNTEGLGVFPVKVVKFTDRNLKIPQIGWNRIFNLRSALFDSIPEMEFMYFVHSYYVPLNEWTLAQASYGLNYSAAMQKNNFFGCQFHPEKSSDPGAVILSNFLKIK
jgi:glutamine amidotransferase